jgi:osmotically-inducible protein OsmY
MIRAEEVVGAVLATLEREPRVKLHSYPIDVSYQDGIVTLSGEVAGIAAKKLALELAATPRPVTGIVDRLRVAPAERMEDGAIRAHVCNAFLSEPAFVGYSVRALVKQEIEPVRTLDCGQMLEVEVTGGVVVLNGSVQSLTHKRLAGVIAWWVPGSREVVNGIEVLPAMQDNDDEVVDAVRLVLEKDPLVNAAQIRPGCRNLVVTLEGAVSTESGKAAAESDAWYVFGVNGVVNKITVI